MYWHVTIATEGRFSLDSPLPLVVAVLRACRALLLFAVVDDHVHVVLYGERAAVGAIVSGLSRALAAVVAVELQPARIRPIADRAHLRSLVGYLAGQPARHGIASWEGSCLLDLLGARRIGFDAGPIAEALPREAIAALALRGAGFDVDAILPASDALVRTHGPVRGYRSALAVAGLAARGPRSWRRPEIDRAWRRLAAEVGFHLDARDAAGISARNWQRIALEPFDSTLVNAIRRRIAFEALQPARRGEGTPRR